MLAEIFSKFGYPDTLIKEYRHWYLLLRKQQITLGSMVLMHKDPHERAGSVPPEAYAELSEIFNEIETNGKKIWGFDKINHYLLMMVDPQVHYHIIPRYAASQERFGGVFHDRDYPKPCRFDQWNDIGQGVFQDILQEAVMAFSSKNKNA